MSGGRCISMALELISMPNIVQGLHSFLRLKPFRVARKLLLMCDIIVEALRGVRRAHWDKIVNVVVYVFNISLPCYPFRCVGDGLEY